MDSVLSLIYKALKPAEAAMSNTIGPTSLPERLSPVLPAGIGAPLLGIAWVFLNVVLIGLGIWDSAHSPIFSLSAGAIDGGILGWIVSQTFSAKLHAGTAGLLGGYGFQDILNNFKLTGQYGRWIHTQLDPVLDALLGKGHEPLHDAVVEELVWIACTAAIVVLATLIVKLLSTAENKPAEGR